MSILANLAARFLPSSVTLQLDDIQALIGLMARLPGLGPRSARRIVLHLIRRRSGPMADLARLMATVSETSRECLRCGNVTDAELCPICADEARANGELCVVEDVADLQADIEQALA